MTFTHPQAAVRTTSLPRAKGVVALAFVGLSCTLLNGQEPQILPRTFAEFLKPGTQTQILSHTQGIRLAIVKTKEDFEIIKDSHLGNNKLQEKHPRIKAEIEQAMASFITNAKTDVKLSQLSVLVRPLSATTATVKHVGDNYVLLETSERTTKKMSVIPIKNIVEIYWPERSYSILVRQSRARNGDPFANDPFGRR